MGYHKHIPCKRNIIVSHLWDQIDKYPCVNTTSRDCRSNRWTSWYEITKTLHIDTTSSCPTRSCDHTVECFDMGYHKHNPYKHDIFVSHGIMNQTNKIWYIRNTSYTNTISLWYITNTTYTNIILLCYTRLWDQTDKYIHRVKQITTL